MRPVRLVDPKSRWGQVSERWGNVVLPEGELQVDDLFRFSDSGPEGAVFRVSRVNVFPPDAGKRLCYYLRLAGNPNDS